MDVLVSKLRAFGRAYEELGLRGALWVSLRFVKRRLFDRRDYRHWVKAQEWDRHTIAQAQAELACWSQPPTFSVIVPVYNTDSHLLERAVASVRQQVYPHWELWLVDDASTAAHVRPQLDRYPAQDGRIRVVHQPQNGGISTASNAALDRATGEFIALLDHDDELAPQALYENARVLQAKPELDFLYSDEDFIEPTGQRSNPFFKPDWSPDYFHGCMYTCHLGVYRTALVREIGGFRSEFDGAQDWDLVLRLTEVSDRIHHIPQVLYHWRITPTSVTSGAEAKPWAYVAAQGALEDMVQRSPYKGTVKALPQQGFYRVQRQLVESPLVSIIIPTAGKAMTSRTGVSFVEHCLDSLQRSTYPNLEVVIVDGYDLPEPVLAAVKATGAVLERCGEPFNFSMRLNRGVAASRGEVLLFLNDDVEVVSPDWVESMVQFAQMPAVGAVGARLLFPTGHIQHSGVIVLNGNPGHAFYDALGHDPGYFLSNRVNRNYLAVTGACLMVRREVYHQVGGMDERFPVNYNDVDFCLKLHQAGFRNLVTPFAELIHHESATRQRGIGEDEIRRFKDRWCPYLDQLGGDPYYNPNLSIERGDFTLA